MGQRFARGLLILTTLLIGQSRLDGNPAQRAQAASVAGPRLVLLIRHAEKPDAAKEDNDPNLSKRGFERAEALAKVIPANFAQPDFILATRQSAHSNRPVETVEPLAKRLNLQIESSFKDDEFAALAHEVMTDPKFAGKTVLIAWHHGKIPELAHSLGASNAPDKWDGKQFDRVWEISYDHGMATFSNRAQRALPGDAEK